MTNVIQFPKKIGVTAYTPEMNEVKPLADIEAKLSFFRNKWRLKTSLELKGRGITFDGWTTDGRNIYYVTNLAFRKIEAQYSISMECLLD